jgi:SAM-dependent methyltransferase
VASSDDEPHSQRYFTDARDHWWHDDYVALLAKRFRVDGVRRVLDVGCGQGHFTRVWARHLPRGFALTGVDREGRSLAVARARCADFAVANGLEGTFSFVAGAVEKLPFDDDTFDMSMCQTLLIHVRDPDTAFAEMVRVTKPGGLVLAAEPNNLAGFQGLAARGPGDEIGPQLRAVEFTLRCVRGKWALGLGWNNFGVHLPKLFATLEDVAYYNNDRAWVMEPPYARPQERTALADMRRDVEAGVYGWERDEARRYYVAGGGTVEAFERDYDAMLAAQADQLQRFDANAWYELTAFAGLVAGGRKPLR